ncbi:MAG: mechanosensitive ion channel [Deltaproteobacteria bacterium]|nr:mechanosensitive ion channel [Deltaproteobacteria bacterium]
MEKWTDIALSLIKTHGPAVLYALIIFVLGWITAKIIYSVLKNVLRKARMEETLVSFIGNLAYTLMVAFVVIASLSKLGVDTTSFAAIIAAAGLAVGFALQNSLGNFASGVMIIGLKPFKIGDYIETSGTAGVVEEISVFATKLRTPDNKTIIVPNGSITAGNITNYSAKDTRRVDMVFGIGYNDDIKQAKKILLQIICEDDRVLKNPEPMVVVAELADSSVNFAVRPWVKSADYWDVLCHVTEQVKLRFDAAKISIPYPQTDVHLHSVVPGNSTAA